MRRLYTLILVPISLAAANPAVTRAYAETVNTAPPPAPWWTTWYGQLFQFLALFIVPLVEVIVPIIILIYVIKIYRLLKATK